MEYYKRYLDKYLWDDFKNLQKNPYIFGDYVSYYRVLTTWVKKHLDKFGDIITNDRLDTILDIDVEKYIAKSPEILLSKEPTRMFSEKPKTMNLLIMRISNTLWDLVKRPSGKDCPRCIHGGLNFVISEVINTKRRVLTLECFSCGWLENLDGTRWRDGLVNIYPANETDLIESTQ